MVGNLFRNKLVFCFIIFYLSNIVVFSQSLEREKYTVVFKVKNDMERIHITKRPKDEFLSLRYVGPDYPLKDTVIERKIIDGKEQVKFFRDYGWAIDTSVVSFKLNNKSVPFIELLKYKDLTYVKNIKYIDGLHRSIKNKKYVGLIIVNIIIPKREVKKRGSVSKKEL